ncbi:MAG: hypothetical protein AB8G99_15515 [Planctomycetaceae bacterium]
MATNAAHEQNIAAAKGIVVVVMLAEEIEAVKVNVLKRARVIVEIEGTRGVDAPKVATCEVASHIHAVETMANHGEAAVHEVA